MAFDVTLAHVLGVAAGVAMVGVGAFVLLARPHGTMNRAFFVLALLDGVSTVLFELAFMAEAAEVRAYFAATYYDFFIAFVAALGAFAALFPRPVLKRRPALVPLVVLAVGAALFFWHLLDHAAFWTPLGGAFRNEWAGNLVSVGFAAAVATLAVRSTTAFLADPSATHRQQGVLVFSGMIVAYAPDITTKLVAQVRFDAGLLVTGTWSVMLAWWSFVALAVVLVGAGARIVAVRDPARREGRRYLGGALAVVAAVTVGAVAFPAAAIVNALQVLALLALPAFLGYAIVRYEVFDIDARLRQAATLTLGAGAASATFLLLEVGAETLLQTAFAGRFSSEIVSGLAAALVTAPLMVPLFRAARRMSGRLVPALPLDELQRRKIEVYRHSLHAALRDGSIDPRENRTLAALRESLGIEERVHAHLMDEVRALEAPAPA